MTASADYRKAFTAQADLDWLRNGSPAPAPAPATITAETPISAAIEADAGLYREWLVARHGETATKAVEGPKYRALRRHARALAQRTGYTAAQIIADIRHDHELRTRS